MTTPRTFLRRIARVNGQHWNSRLLRLVFDKGSQLSESPIMQLGSNFATGPNPKANVLEVFQDDCLLCALRFSYELFADLMISVTGKALLFPRTHFEQATGRLRTLRLQFSSQSAMSLSEVANMRTAKGLPFRVGGNSSNTEVNTEESFRLIDKRLDNVDGGKQKPFALAAHKVRLALSRFQQPPLPLTTNEGNLLATRNRPDGNIVATVSENAVIIGNRAVTTKDAPSLFIEFIGVGNFGDKTDNNLRRQTVLFFERLIDKALKLERAKGFLRPRNIGGLVGRRVSAMQSFKQKLRLLFGWFKLQAYCQFHVLSIAQTFYIRKYQPLPGFSKFDPTAKVGGFRLRV